MVPPRAFPRVHRRAAPRLRAGALAFLCVALLGAAGALSAQAQVRQSIREVTPEEERDIRADRRSPELERQFQRALMAWRTGASLLEAETRLARVIEARPTDVQARKLRARVLLEMDRPREALRDAERAAQLRLEDGEAHLLHAEAARRSDRREPAARALDLAAEHLPQQSALHTRFSWNALLMDRFSQAEAFGRVALALDSTSAPAYRQLARVFVRRERPDEAAAVLARGLRAGVVQPRAVREEDLFQPLLDHPHLEALLEP